jgi:site-specific recombinase XerD
MPKTIFDKAIAKVPALSNSISLFRGKLTIARYAKGSITDYCHALYKAVDHIGKLPEEFSQQEVDDYLAFMMSRKPQPAVAQFKHFVYGLKCYLSSMGFRELERLQFPRIRREKKLPRILSTQDVMTLLCTKDLYSKALLTTIYDCGLRASEACNLKWGDIDFNRQTVHIKRGKGNKDRVVPISINTIKILRCFRGVYPSKDFVFKRYGADAPITTHMLRKRLKKELADANLDTSLTVHSLRHAYATHLLEHGEDIQSVQLRLGHKSVQTTMMYLHVAQLESHKRIRLVDVISAPYLKRK